MGRVIYMGGEPDPQLGEVQHARIRLSPGQLRVFMSGVPITIALAGIRGGKTHVGALKSLFYSMMHPTGADETHLICSPTYQMSKVPVEKLYKLLYDRAVFPVCPLIKYQRSERTFVLAAANGQITRLMVRSLHDPDKVRGIKALSAWLDEAAYLSTYAWEVIQGRLADSAGPCWITTTPAGYNWVYDLYEQARNGDRDIKVVHWASTENSFIEQTGIARLISRLDPQAYKQEVLARFIRGRGVVYHSFNRNTHVKKARFDRNKPVWIGQDFNVDPMASVLAQPFTTRSGQEGIHIFAERKVGDSSTWKLVSWLNGFLKDKHVPKENVTFYPDAAGAQRSTTGKSDIRILRSADYHVDAPARNPLIKDRVNCVNGLLSPMEGDPRILIDPSCTELIASLEKQIWKPESDPPTPDKEHGFDHLNDALGYLCWRRYPLKASTMIPRRTG